MRIEICPDFHMMLKLTTTKNMVGLKCKKKHLFPSQIVLSFKALWLETMCLDLIFNIMVLSLAKMGLDFVVIFINWCQPGLRLKSCFSVSFIGAHKTYIDTD